MKDKTITVRVPDDLGHGVFIFQVKNYMTSEEMQLIREGLIYCISSGCVVLPNNIDMIYPRLYDQP